MYVCIYMCVCISVCVYMCVCVYVCVMCVCICVYICVCVYMCVYVCVYMYVCVCKISKLPVFYMRRLKSSMAGVHQNFSLSTHWFNPSPTVTVTSDWKESKSKDVDKVFHNAPWGLEFPWEWICHAFAGKKCYKIKAKAEKTQYEVFHPYLNT